MDTPESPTFLFTTHDGQLYQMLEISSLKQVGAVIVNADNVILGIGYNGFPRGCCDSDLPWAKVRVHVRRPQFV